MAQKNKTLKRKIAQIFIGLLLCVFWSSSAYADVTINTEITIGDDTEADGSSSGSSDSSFCDGVDSALSESLGCSDDSEDSIDLTQFDGEFAPPDSDGYDPALTQNDNARDLIQTVVKFVLSFLGIIAVVIVIYGGVLYVTSRGDSDQVETAKKSIMYAVIGILIVISSFALINTVFQAADPTPTGNTANTGSDNIGESGAAFDVSAALGELTSITESYLDAYETILFVNSKVQEMKAIPVPTLINIPGLISGLTFWEFIQVFEDPEAVGKDPSDYEIIDPQDLNDYLGDIEGGLVDIQSKVDPLSEAYQAAEMLLNFIRLQNLSLEKDFNLWPIFSGLMIPTASADGGGCSARTYSDLATTSGITYENSTVYDNEIELIDDYVCSGLDLVLDEATADYNERVSDLLADVNTLASLFDSTSSGSTLVQVSQAFDTLVTTLGQAQDQITNTTARSVVDAVDQLYSLIENIRFVSAVINASAVTGHAPMIVRLNALGSTDPSGQTIQAAQYEWDLDGDGQFDDATGPTTNYKYEEAGTYQVAVRITSSDDDIAAGLARIVIVVEPAVSVIKLNVKGGDEETVIADYSMFPVYTVENYKATMNEASEGLSFDASNSTAGDGTPLVSYEWDFGDGETVKGPTESVVQHAYGTSGKYLLTLKVVDATGVSDQFYFNIYVASPAAKIRSSQNSGVPGDTITFDGRSSNMDLGSIVNYEWSIAEEDGSSLNLSEPNESVLEYTFTDPGNYTISLTVTDSSGKQDTATQDILIASQAPVVLFDCDVLSQTQPNVFTCDGSASYDPDESDTLIDFEWDFEGEVSQDYSVLSQNDDGSIITIRFNEVGNHKVSLSVKDDHPEGLQKTGTLSQTVSVESVLDVDLSLAQTAYYLDESGEVEVTFTAYSSSASAFEIDYGDGEGDYTQVIKNGYASFTHVYQSADVFYVTLKAVNEDFQQTSMSRRVYVSDGDMPIAALDVSANGLDVGFGDTLYGYVGMPFIFDASASRNTNGLPTNLNISWNFGDSTTSTQTKTTHVFDERDTYTVTLTVTDTKDPSLKSVSTVNIVIQGVAPEIRGISLVPQGTNLETPVPIIVNVDAVDQDGGIEYMEVYYFDVNNPDELIDTVISKTSSATLSLQTKGITGEEVTYVIGATVVDKDGTQVSSLDVLEESQWPTLTVTNGPNESPVASFTVDRSLIMLGDEVTFSNASFDKDGEIVTYIWDIDGDGVFNNNEPQTEPNLTYQFTQVAPEGIEIRLKVIDNVGASDISDPVTIIIDSNADAPIAAFLYRVDAAEVQFENTSSFDTENGSEANGFIWDFDLDEDSDGDGEADNDSDSTEENPVHEYDQEGVYEVSLKVIDNSGQTDEVTQMVRAVETTAPDADFDFEISNLSVDFEDLSEADRENEVDIKSYEWDFGDGSSSNEANPDHDFSTYGTYTVTLTVTDTQGKTDSKSKKLELESPIQPLELSVSSIPEANSQSKIILSSSVGMDIAFFFEASGGSGNYEYQIDRNLFFDTDGNGKTYDDQDFVSEDTKTYSTYFDPAWQPIVVQISVIDLETGDSDTVTFQVVFENWEGGANLLSVTPLSGLALVVTLLVGVSAAAIGLSGTSRN